MKQVVIYTDGACSYNPGPGGWCAILFYHDVKKVVSGNNSNTTNNRMELTAALEALKLLKEPCEVSLHSDSAYLINAFKLGWIYNWEKKNWRTSSKTQVENIDLWNELLNLSRVHKVDWMKVKGHADDLINNECDKIARNEVKKV